MNPNKIHPIHPIHPMQPVNPEDNVIHGDYHSLFWEEKPREMIHVNADKKDEIKLYTERPTFCVYKLFIGDFDENGQGIQRIINKLQNAKPEDVLELHISSHGGNVDELLELYNLCDSLFFGSIVSFVNFGYSAGAMAFLLGDERVVYEHSNFMVHSYSAGAYGKRDDLLNRINHLDKVTNKFFMNALSPYMSEKELKKMNKGRDFWMSADEMLKRGIATHIVIDGEIHPAEEYINLTEPEYFESIKKKEKKKLKGKKIKKLNKKFKEVTKTKVPKRKKVPKKKGF